MPEPMSSTVSDQHVLPAIGIRVPGSGDEALSREIRELTRRWGIGNVHVESGAAGEEIVLGGGGDVSVVIPHQRLGSDHPLWHAAAKELLATLPGSDEILSDPEAVVAPLFHLDASGNAVCRFDLPGILYGLLTRREELLSPQRDEHGRWQSESSLLAPWLDIPLVDLLARGLGAIVARVLGIPATSAIPKWGVALTFDIDFAGHRVREMPRLALRSLRSGGPMAAARSIAGSIAGRVRPKADPALDFDAIADRFEDNNLHGLFFAQSLHRSRWDDYELNHRPDLIRALRRVRARGHHVGVHGSYVTADHGAPFLRMERERLAAVVGGPADCYRAHYLRTRTPEEESRCLIPAGFREDWSIGYSSREGFRLGTAHPVETESGITLRPLHMMDVTLRFHRGYSAEVALLTGIRLMSRVKAVGGVAVVLWHPHNLSGPLWPAPWPEVPWELVQWARENGAEDALA
jgi:hypothetical protein